MKKLLLSLLFFVSLPAFSQALKTQPSTPSKDGAEGLLVNTTLSSGGQLFFLSFVEHWREKRGSDKYTLEVAEQYSRRNGSFVWISFGQRQLFSSPLPIKLDRIRALGEQAAESSFAAIAALALPFSGEKDPDIALDEL